MSSDGFYKRVGDELLFAPNRVHGPGFTLLRADHLSYTYPVDGWTWFDTLEEALAALGIPTSAVDLSTLAARLDRIDPPLTTQQQVNHATLEQRAVTALSNNADFLAIASPTNAQAVAQVRALTRQVDGIIRMMLNRLDSIDDA